MSAYTDLVKSLKELNKVQFLDLSNQCLTEIPPEVFQLTNLKKLCLSYNQIEVIPSAISQLTNLTELHLFGNQIEVIPPEISQLANLTLLFLGNNQIEVIPPEIGQLANLTLLGLENNQIEVIPPEIGQLANLTELALWSNQIDIIPYQIGQLINLTEIRLFDNQIEVIPPEIGQLANLNLLSLENNQIEAIPPELHQITSLNYLNLARNQIEVISPEISQLTNLVELDLWSNQIDIIPYQIGYIKTLTRLELGRNHLGTVPSEIGQLTNLIELHLAFNQIRSLPNELFELINLEVLSLEFNLIRFLPNRVNQLSRLRILNLGRNRLAQFPVGISQLFNLRQLNLSDNQIKFLPSSINDLTKLEHFWFSRNYLKQIPIELWELSRLTELHLDNNRIHQIPSELKNLKNLISLNLSHNRLTEIPPQILDLQKLETLNLEGNIRHSIETDFGELLTYRERMELALQQAEIAKKEADHANQVKGQFLSQMSHELRTPMNGVIGFLNLISKETLTPKQKEYLRRATNSGQHLLNVIDEILQFSELEKGQVKDQKVVFDLVDTCHQVMEMVTPLSRQKNLDLHFDHSQVMSTEWVGDQQKIKQVLVNLLGNAIKFTNQGKISLKLLQISNGIRIEVSDTGIGIATEHIEDIFEPFTQASNGKTRNFPGTGLGLTISQQLIQKMGGQIEVESQLKKGSTFWLELPLQKIEVKPQTKAKDIILDDFTGRKALVVDDELISREVARVYLQRCGFLVDEAFGGSDCLKQLKANRYDLIIMDLQMPELDGFKVVEQIRKLERKLGQKEVAILGLSADVTGEVQDRYKLEEVGDYLGKPFKMGELKHKIRKLLNS